jgi:hypothetical protein
MPDLPCDLAGLPLSLDLQEKSMRSVVLILAATVWRNPWHGLCFILASIGVRGPVPSGGLRMKERATPKAWL